MAERKRKKVRKIDSGMQVKLLATFLILFILMCGLVGRIIYINAKKGSGYEKTVLSQQQQKSGSSRIAYKRGSILDTNGNNIALSKDVYNLIIDCYVINSNYERYYEPIMKAVTSTVKGIKEEKIQKLVDENKVSRYVIVRDKLDYKDIKQLKDMIDKDEKSGEGNLSPIWLEKLYVRDYPFKSLASSTIGFVSDGNVGIGGIESEYNDELNGMDGKIYNYINSDNKLEKTVKNAQDGNTLQSTLDISIQKVVEGALEEFNNEHQNTVRKGFGALNMGALVMDPNTGEILAMSDYPNFDLNNPTNTMGLISSEELATMSKKEKAERLNSIWNNYCVTSTYEPGSTAKPFTVAAALETGTIDTTTCFSCNGFEVVNGTKIYCDNRAGHGYETLEDAMAFSCNDALMQIALHLGVKNFTRWQNIFGFGLKTQIDLPGEASTANFVYSAKKMTSIDLATNSFGQNFNTTMVQLASAFSSIINGGKYYRPHVIKRIIDSKGNTVKTVEPTLLKETVTPETAEHLKQYLKAVVEHEKGTGKAARIKGYSIGGKTGTAEKIPRGMNNYLVSFIGFAPVEDPKAVVYVVIDEPNSPNQEVSSYAAETARKIFEKILPYMNVYKNKVDKEDKEEN